MKRVLLLALVGLPVGLNLYALAFLLILRRAPFLLLPSTAALVVAGVWHSAQGPLKPVLSRRMGFAETMRLNLEVLFKVGLPCALAAMIAGRMLHWLIPQTRIWLQ